MAFRFGYGIPFDSLRFSLRAASCGLAFVSPDSQESAKPQRIKGVHLHNFEGHAHSKGSVRVFPTRKNLKNFTRSKSTHLAGGGGGGYSDLKYAC